MVSTATDAAPNPSAAALQPAEVLAEHEHAERHGDERVDVVAERRLDDVVVVDGPDVDEPVHGDAATAASGQLPQAVAGGAHRRRTSGRSPAERQQALPRPRTTTRCGAGGSRPRHRRAAGGTRAGTAPRACRPRRAGRRCRGAGRPRGRLRPGAHRQLTAGRRRPPPVVEVVLVDLEVPHVVAVPAAVGDDVARLPAQLRRLERHAVAGAAAVHAHDRVSATGIASVCRGRAGDQATA